MAKGEMAKQELRWLDLLMGGFTPHNRSAVVSQTGQIKHFAQVRRLRTGLVLHIPDCIGQAGNKAVDPTILAHKCFD